MFLGGGSYLATGGGDGAIRLWDAVTRSQSATLYTTHEALDISINGNSTKLACLCQPEAERHKFHVEMWDLTSFEHLFSIFGEGEERSRCLQFDSTGARLLTFGVDGVTIRDADTGSCLKRLPIKNPSKDFDVWRTFDDSRLIACDRGKPWTMYDGDSGASIPTNAPENWTTCGQVCCGRSSSVVAIASGRAVCMWNYSTYAMEHDFEVDMSDQVPSRLKIRQGFYLEPSTFVKDMCFGSTDNVLIAALPHVDQYLAIFVWSVNTRTLLHSVSVMQLLDELGLVTLSMCLTSNEVLAFVLQRDSRGGENAFNFKIDRQYLAVNEATGACKEVFHSGRAKMGTGLWKKHDEPVFCAGVHCANNSLAVLL